VNGPRRRDGSIQWQTERLPRLRIDLSAAVRSTLTTWLRAFGDANSLPGLRTGSAEQRLNYVVGAVGDRRVLVWTTPEHWAAGEGVRLRIPVFGLEFQCALHAERLSATDLVQVLPAAPHPGDLPGSVGIEAEVDQLVLPAQVLAEPDRYVSRLAEFFQQAAIQPWRGFAQTLHEALEIDERFEVERSARLTAEFTDARRAVGRTALIWTLSGVPRLVGHELSVGEWLDVLPTPAGLRAERARVLEVDDASDSVVVEWRGTAGPPSAPGILRPVVRRKLMDQKRAILAELTNPSGNLPHIVRLVADPESMPVPSPATLAEFAHREVAGNPSQARAVALALGLEDGQALLIQGPPGTGKSTTAAEISMQLMRRNPAVRILVCSHSNHGTDNMLLKVLPFLADARSRVGRVGFYERVAEEARPFYAPPDADLADKNIVFTTIDALALQDTAGARLYDVVILDEANRAGMLDSLLALARGRRMILVGDSMQLQPVASGGDQRASPNSLFTWLVGHGFSSSATVLLDEQNRMHPTIGALVSRVFYAGRVRTGPGAPTFETGISAFPCPVTWVDTRLLPGSHEERGSGTSYANVAEAELISVLVDHIAVSADRSLSIGIIAAYADQVELLRRLLHGRTWTKERHLEINTVDAFEGREKDVIVLSLVRANRRRATGFLQLEQRLNVALSRSRRLMLIVGDMATLNRGVFERVLPAVVALGQVRPALALLDELKQEN
jgi:DNA polymerase III delta prime subunit